MNSCFYLSIKQFVKHFNFFLYLNPKFSLIKTLYMKLSLSGLRIFLVSAMGLLLSSAYGQIGLFMRSDYDLKGPVRLYKQVEYKDFQPKFEHYEPKSVKILNWYLCDKEGRVLFEQAPENDTSKFYDRYLHHYKNNRVDIGLNMPIDSDGVSRLHKKLSPAMWLYKYPDNYTLKRYDYDDNELMEIEKYNHQNLVVEDFFRPNNEKRGYRYTWKYDDNGNLIEKDHYNATGKHLSREIWKRDAAGHTLQYLQYDSTGRLTKKSVHAYNRAAREVQEVVYRGDGSVIWGDTSIYLHDTLLTAYIQYGADKNIVDSYLKLKYDDQNRLIRKDYVVLGGKPQNGNYTLLMYDKNGNLTVRLYYDSSRLIEKSVRSDFVGTVYQKSVRESYDENGGVKAIKIWKMDQYGNERSFEHYQYETKFGERVKIPVEKRTAQITYYDKDTPEVGVKLLMERKKKKDILNIDLLHTEGHIIFYSKEYGGKPFVTSNRVVGLSVPYSFLSDYYPYFIVQNRQDDEYYLFPLPPKSAIEKKTAKIGVKNLKKVLHKK